MPDAAREGSPGSDAPAGSFPGRAAARFLRCRVAIILLLIALALRWGPALARVKVLRNPDAIEYREFAESMVDGKGYGYRPGNRESVLASIRDRVPYGRYEWVPTALRPPGYPLFLAA